MVCMAVPCILPIHTDAISHRHMFKPGDSPKRLHKLSAKKSKQAEAENDGSKLWGNQSLEVGVPPDDS